MNRRIGDGAMGRNSRAGQALSRRCAGASVRPFVVLLTLAACVPVPPDRLPQAPGAAQPGATSYPDVDGGVTYSSLHFQLRGYNERDLQAVSVIAEDIFNRVGSDTGLYSYLAGQTYAVVVYKDVEEYTTKTKQPAGSRAVAAGTTLYTYLESGLEAHMAHEMSHLIFRAYMGGRVGALYWLNEGLAMVQEVTRMTHAERTAFRSTQTTKLRVDRQAFSQMTFFAGENEKGRREDIWYLQVESVVDFLMKQGSSLTFAALLNDLRNGVELDQAISAHYSARFRGIADLETAWKASL